MIPDETPPPPDSRPPGSPPGPGPAQPSTLRAAVTYGIVVIGLGLATLLVALASSDGLRTALVVAAPIVVGVGALGGLWRTYTVWRAGGRWQVWQGAAWFLLATFVVFLFSTAPALVG
ncbi:MULTISPECIES: hypothetical protein [unclassified Gordonia (in: high G+C Gram-positive bacteria)]|uniref:hypothetical protein n=1 Tax=unclassified Gordonia (in: high G+C Gram-positive bacteria) TaxID=2657482 RepID=UPI0009AED6D2|nr:MULTISPECIES: hypothetical protein [unclassified Gordonia (in: high G+C Gram-positive bacteria)]MDF3282520.1 hypothetical protein [Gordonia sp. N1V]OPX09521.1 hypothetical protein B1964_24955 [Gordonia sp. i37]